MGRHSAPDDVVPKPHPGRHETIDAPNRLDRLFEPGGHEEFAETVAGGGALSEGPGSRAQVRNVVAAMIGITIFVAAMLASYSGAFAKPTPRHLEIAIVADAATIRMIQQQPGLALSDLPDARAARRAVLNRDADAALIIPADGGG